MRVFVTGAEGQLARSLQFLGKTRHGLDILCLGRPAFDLTDTASAEQAVVDARPDVIINAAAYTAVDKAESEPHLAFKINADGAAAMARAAAHLAVPLIQISTDYVFSGQKQSAYVETDDVGPLGVYGDSKFAAELMVRNLAPRHAILRTSWVYSPVGTNFVKTMIRLAGERQQLRIVGDQWGCPTSAADLAEVAIDVAQAMMANPGAKGIYHAAGQGETNWAGFAQAIFKAMVAKGLPVPEVEEITTNQYPTPARRPANSRLNCRKLDSEFGISFPAWRDSLEKCMDQLLG